MNAPEQAVTVEGTARVVPSAERAIGNILIEEGKLDADHIDQIMQLQRADGLRFGEAALRLGLITERDLHGAVAKQYDLPRLLAEDDRATSELVVAHAPFNPRAEEIRSLRTQLLIRWTNEGIKRGMVSIVSPGRGEGRSYVAANLAVAFAQLGERTLLIDADMRKPRQHRIFDIPDRVGLSTVLSGRANGNSAIPVSEFGRLSVVPAGALPPNPQELLSRHALADFLQKAHTDFDIVIVDTPPAKYYADAQMVAFRAGSAIVLSRKDHTRLADTTSLIQNVASTGARVTGTVFNAF